MAKILKARYYILQLKDITNVRCLYYYFSSKESAKFCLNRRIPSNERKWYKIVSGNYLKKYQPKFYKTLRIYPVKYKYSPEMKTAQAKKTYRTVMRRRLRRMGLHVLGQKEGRIKEQVKRSKWVKNQQWVANSPTTEARIFRMDRTGLNRYFAILSIEKSKRVGDLCRVLCYCFHLSKKTIIKKEVRVKNTDVLTPYLTSELQKLLETKCMKVPNEIWSEITSGTLKPIKGR